jgi:formate-dependent nitrite reductase membrane component NrfD
MPDPETYYDIPPIKAPHWRWLIIVYFFLAGLTSSSFIIATLSDLVGRDRSLARAGRYLSLAALLPCPVLLTFDLGRPERALHMFRIVKLRSPMSLGSWALLVFGLINGASAVAQFLADRTGSPKLDSPRRTLGILGLPFALFLSGYTGVLLGATNVPLWGRSYLLLGPTFVASAFSSGFAALSLLLGFSSAKNQDTAQALARGEVMCLTTEIALLAVTIRHLGKLGQPLTTGALGRLFWPAVVAAGIVAPLLLNLVGIIRGSRFGPSRFAPALVLLGGFTLRLLLIFAGRESARRPRDYFDYTRLPGGWQLPK